MKNRFITFISAFAIFVCFVCSPLQVQASSHGGSGGTHLEGFDTWTLGEKFDYWKARLGCTVAGACGIIFNPANWDYDFFMQYIANSAQDRIDASTASSYDEWIAMQLSYTVDEETQEPSVLMSDELCDAMYQACMKYVNEYTPWQNMKSYDIDNFYACFKNKDSFDRLRKKIEDKTDGQIAVLNMTMSNGYGYFQLGILDYGGLYLYSNTINSYSGGYQVFSAQDWYNLDYKFTRSGNWTDGNGFVYGQRQNDGLDSTAWSMTEISYVSDAISLHTGSPKYPTGFNTNMGSVLVDLNEKEYRVYRTLDDLKQYSVGSRPYFITDKFQNYNASGDNSCILTESELNGSSVYGDVVNYIIGNYPDADGLTEEELRAILDEYFNKLPSGGDSDGGSSSGGGLLDFIDGLGGLFDGVLSILGKLLEYIGKAITLIVDLIDKVIDVIPASIGKLFSALFPFLPQEFFTAIELALVLGVAVIVFKMFRG